MTQLSRILCVSVAMAACGLVQAANVVWVGDSNDNFLNGANWPSNVLPSPTSDTWQVNGLGSVNASPTLALGTPLVFTGTSGKIAFGSVSGSM